MIISGDQAEWKLNAVLPVQMPLLQRRVVGMQQIPVHGVSEHGAESEAERYVFENVPLRFNGYKG